MRRGTTTIPILTPEYLGGIFDANGYVTVTTSKHRGQTKYYLQICLGGFSEEFLLGICNFIGYGSVQCHGQYNYRLYTSTKSAYEFACFLCDHTIIKRQQLQYAILYYLEMNRLGKDIRSSGRYNPSIVQELRKKQKITHEYFKEKMFVT